MPNRLLWIFGGMTLNIPLGTPLKKATLGHWWAGRTMTLNNPLDVSVYGVQKQTGT